MTLCEALRDAFVLGGTVRRPRHDSGHRFYLTNAAGIGVVMRRLGRSEKQGAPVRIDDLEAEDWQVVDARRRGETLGSVFGLSREAPGGCVSDLLPTEGKGRVVVRISELV